MTPAEFAFQNFGRHINPDPIKWPSTIGVSRAGKKSRLLDGSGLIITEGRFRLFGTSFPDAGVLSENMDDKDLTFFKAVADYQYNPPEAPWLAVAFSKAGLEMSALVINTEKRANVVSL